MTVDEARLIPGHGNGAAVAQLRSTIVYALIMALIVGCGGSDPSPREAAASPTAVFSVVPPEATRVVHNDEAQSLVLFPKTSNRNLVLYLHGRDQNEETLIRNYNVQAMVSRLLKAGYAVAALRAEGNAWGNQASVDSYDVFLQEIIKTYGFEDVYLLAESMGGLAAFRLVPREPKIRAVAGLSPVCDARTVSHQADIGRDLASAFVNDHLSTVGPVQVPRIPMMLWASPDDTRVPMKSNATYCISKGRALKAPSTLVISRGNHGDGSNFDGGAVVSFFARYG